ncbi:MAG: 2-amino-4-ketopentanoate thiolase [Halanaerobiales bacterium]|nr:2-amino-4-ketopentanoate thiolase [Halanaerobiales bacterium]
MIDKGTFVRIRKTLLTPEERSPNLPEDTKETRLKMWAKGYLLKDADLFDIVEIKTIHGRILKGRLKEANPRYKHNFGDFVPEILTIRNIIKADLEGDLND